MKQKFLAMTLAACMMLSLLPVSARAEEGGVNPPDTGTGGFTVTGGTPNVDYNFADNTLTITTNTPLTISGTTTDYIVVSGGTEQEPVQLTFSDLIINSDASSALTLTNGSHAIVTLAGENKLGEGWDSIHTTNMVVGNNSTLTFTGSGSLFCCESLSYSKLNIGTDSTVKVQGGTLTLRTSHSHATVAGSGTFIVDGGKAKLRSAEGGAVFGNDVKVTLESGYIDIYNEATSFGAASLAVSGGQLSSTLTGLTFDPAAFTFNGGVVSLAAGIPDALKSGSTSWNGIALEGNTGTVYGSTTLAEDFELAQGQTLTIASGKALTIDSGATLTNRGTITNEGTLVNNGALLNYGAISGTVYGTAPVPASTVTVSFADENGSPLADDTATYGDTIQITATMAAKINDSNVLSRSAAVNAVDFYGNWMEDSRKLGSTTVVSNGDGTVTASLTVALSEDAFEKGLGMGSNWIYADFGGGAGLLDASGYGVFIIDKGAQTPPSAPTMSAKTSASVTLNAVTDVGYGEVQYGYRAAADGEPGHWQTDTKFSGLTPDAAYTFYTRFEGDYYRDAAVSAGCQVTTDAALAQAPDSYSVAEHPVQIVKADGAHLYVTYGDDGYLVSGDAPIVITGTTTEHTVAVRSGCTANITLDGVEIQLADGTPGVCAFLVEGGAVCNLTLTGANTLKSGRRQAGLQVGKQDDASAALTITAASTGSLSATGGRSAAGIGGGAEVSGGVVTIAGGTVTATGGYDAAGIGGGPVGSGGDVTITGGTVTAIAGGDGAAGIGGGYRGSGGAVTITGGTVTTTGGEYGVGIGAGYSGTGGTAIIDGGSVEAGSFTNAPKNSAGADVHAVELAFPAGDTVQALAVRNSGPVAYGCPDTVQPSGKLTLYLPAGDYTGTALIGGKLWTLQFTVASGQTATSTPADTGITVTIPDGGTATITDEGKLKLPGGSTVQVGGGEIVTVPAAGGTVDPADGSVTATPQPSGSSGSSSSRPSASVSGTGGKVTTGSGTVTITPEEGYQIGKITVNGKEVDIPKDGKLTGLKSADKVVVTFEKIPETPETPAVGMGKFSDLETEAWYYEAVTYAVQNGLFSGTSETTFSPDAPMTRAMLMTVLARADGQDTTAPTGGAWYDVGMSWAVENGISDGTNPEGDITREQLATMLYRYAGSPAAPNLLLDFTDAGQVADYAQDAMRWAVSEGIVSGKGNGILDPKGQATRTQVAAMLMRYLQS